MEKLIIILLAIFETIIYTFGMVLVNELPINSEFLIFIINAGALFVLALIIYYLFSFILTKLNISPKPYLYYIGINNFLIGIIFSLLVIILIPNANLNLFFFLIMLSTCCYGIIINAIIFVLNRFFNKKMG